MAAKLVMYLYREFVSHYGRDYADEDPQFWVDGGEDKAPIKDPDTDGFISSLVKAMIRSNHHPAHCYAVDKTKTIIFGCGNCKDDCPNCNFRYVPEGWTEEWKEACEEFEKWGTTKKYGYDAGNPSAPVG